MLSGMIEVRLRSSVYYRRAVVQLTVKICQE
jgi:hypothetical protein